VTNPVFKEISDSNKTEPLVSILIPARNEEKNISTCLESVLKQNYINIEILVLNDNSTDSTQSIVSIIAENNKKVKLINGKPLPENILGKNFACAQLAENAKGAFLLFIDADVSIHSAVIASSINYFNKYKLDVLSVFPTQKISSFGEWLIVPSMNWLLLAFLPLNQVYKSGNISLTAANGQFMMWRKEAYTKTGGHTVASAELVEDMFLAKQAKRKGFNLMTLLGGDFISCRMYTNINSAIEGFSKNFYPGFKISPVSFTLLIFLLFSLNTIPFLLLIVEQIFYYTAAVILLIRIIVSILSKQNIFLNLLLHPIQMIMMLFTGINSMVSFHKRKINWKGRKVFI
jgi:chlorobactene glucosyltransferase